jgi:hypothetical protein
MKSIRSYGFSYSGADPILFRIATSASRGLVRSGEIALAWQGCAGRVVVVSHLELIS